MAFSGAHARPAPAMSDRHHSNGSSYYNMPSLSYTSYNGSQGLIDDRSIHSVDLDRSGLDNINLPVPTKAVTPTRPALGSRLLSTLSSAQPAAVALTRNGSVLHSRAKSLAGFMPKLNTSSTSTPEKQQQTQQTNRIFGDIFNGESAPVRLGIPPSSPTKEESEFIMEYKPTFTERPGPRRQDSAQSHVSNPNASAVRPGWFTRKSTIPAPAPASAPARQQDELLAIDINASMFPNGPADSLSPHAFNDLLLNATKLLQRMQAAYKEKVDYIASIQPEIDAQKEEVEEAETRSRHLKMQLEDVSRKAEDQDRAMQELAVQLMEEKVKVQDAQQAARSTVKLVRQPTDKSQEGEGEGTPRRRKRGSAGSQASDSGFESDADYAESVMSGGAETPLSPPVMTLTPAYDGRDWSINASKSRGERPSLSRQSTVSSATAYSNKRLGSEGAAWATVEQLRGENHGLRRQMEEMQKTLQGCIDFVGTVKA